jgi:hypothetical protein
LARVEVGGILATFTQFPAPFEAVGPSQYELPAYKQLLLDGSQTHYWALARDPEARRVAKIEPNTETLAYIRRLTVARHFLFAAIRGYAGNITPLQLTEAASQKKNLDDLRDTYSSNVAQYLAALNFRTKSTKSKTNNRYLVDACNIQLAAEPRSLAKGTATSSTP